MHISRVFHFLIIIFSVTIGMLVFISVVARAQTTEDGAIEEAIAVHEAILATAMATGTGTPDGQTPAVEGICTTWGFSGKVNGLCTAYCEAMDCDDVNPQASDQACARVFDKIIVALGDTPFPTCQVIYSRPHSGPR